MRFLSRPKRKPAKQDLPGRRVVVMEEGAPAFEGLAHPNGPDETVLVAQWRNEAPEQFARRVVTRLGICERSGQSIDVAMLLLAPKSNPTLASLRASLARALISHMAAGGSGELVIVVTEVEAALRHERWAMIESLLEEHPENHVAIRLQFHVELDAVA